MIDSLTTPAPRASLLDPRTVMLAFVSVAIWLSTSSQLLVCLIWLGVVYAILLLSVIPSDRLTMVLRVVGWSLLPSLIVLVLYTVFGDSPDPDRWRLGPVVVSAGNMLTGLQLAVRFMALIALARVLTMWITPSGLASALTRWFQPLTRLGVKIGNLYYLLFFITRLTPAIAEEARIVRIGQQSRGYRPGRSWLQRVRGSTALIVPVFAAAIRRSERLALGLTSRGFNPEWVPTSVMSLRFGAIDWIVCAVIVAGWAVWISGVFV
jgi:energy-coupling factor transporter transmembrane protein EcfT